MKKLSSSWAAAVVACGTLACFGEQPVETGEPDIISHRTNPHGVAAQPTAGSTSPASPILYHGGPVLVSPSVNVYVIWYGNWNQNNGSDTSSGQQIMRDFLNAIGGSPYFNINKSYPNSAGNAPSGLVSFSGETTDSGSYGTRLNDSKITAIVQRAINSGSLPADANGVYFVLTSSNVAENSGFCTRYCGWHTRGSISGTDIKYSFVGNAARCLNACAAQTASPNANAGVDAMISVVAHELEEATTDPDLNAWYDAGGAENADKCAWTFGQAQYQVVNLNGAPAWANMLLGTRNFLIQRNLYHNYSGINGVGDYCLVSEFGQN